MADRIVFRSVEYKDGITTVSVYSPHLQFAHYRGQFSLSNDNWQAMRACLEVGAEDNPLGLQIEFYHGTQDAQPVSPTT